MRAYASTTHCTWLTVACNEDCRAGRATLTTVPSINAMLEPRMVAASTHGPLVGRGELHQPARIAPSSQGNLTAIMTAIFPRLEMVCQFALASEQTGNKTSGQRTRFFEAVMDL